MSDHPTKTSETQQDAEKRGLSDRQVKAIPLIVTSPTYTEGCRRAGINPSTLYEWLRDPIFKSELTRQRDQITQDGFALLAHSLTQAVEVLTGLLIDDDKRLRRMAAKDVVEYFVKCKETQDIQDRLAAIEATLERQKGQRI